MADPYVWLNPPKRFFDAPTEEEIAAFYAEGAQDSVHISADGRVMHRLTPQAACHVGYLGRCVAAPAIQAAYDHFNSDLGHVVTLEGETITAGPLSGDIGHSHGAPTARDIRAHYNGSADWSEQGKGRPTGVPAWRGHTVTTADKAGSVVASVRYNVIGKDIWGTGALSPNVTPSLVASIRAGGASGDWLELQRGRGMVLLGSVMVPSPGMRGISRKLAPMRRMRSGSTEFDWESAPVIEFDHDHDEEVTALAADSMGDDAGCGCNVGAVNMPEETPSGLLFNAEGQAVSPMTPLETTRAVLALHAAVRDMAARFDEVVGSLTTQLSDQNARIVEQNSMIAEMSAASIVAGVADDSLDVDDDVDSEVGLTADAAPVTEGNESTSADSADSAESADGQVEMTAASTDQDCADVLSAEPIKPMYFEHNEIVLLPDGAKGLVCSSYAGYGDSADRIVVVRPQLPDGLLVGHDAAIAVAASALKRTGMRARWGAGEQRTVLHADGSEELVADDSSVFEEVDIEAERAELSAAAQMNAEQEIADLDARFAALLTADLSVEA